jgi:hypothetical protein
MYNQVSQAIVILFVWVFCLLQDKWFDKLLTYQIKGQAEKARSSASKAIDFYNKTKNRTIWIMLAFALTIILLSSHVNAIAVRVIAIIIGVLFCIAYIIIKLIPYNKSSAFINKR